MSSIKSVVGTTSKRASFIMPKMDSNTLAIDSFPEEVQGKLSDAFDNDGNGLIECQELVQAADLYAQTKVANSLLRKGMYFTAAMSILLIGCIAGLTYGIVDMSKDTQVQGRALMTKEDEPISVSTNEVKISLAVLPFLPEEISSSVADISFTAEDNDVIYHRKTLAIDIIPDTAIKLETTAGDLLTWNLENHSDITISLKDGTTWAKDMTCSKCTATNVFASPKVNDGINKFLEATYYDHDGRLLDAFTDFWNDVLGIGCTPDRKRYRRKLFANILATCCDDT